ncbi:unnamed protein product [Clonostachys solani]|uniref:Uncharacterized protein n=1 Tax=Clonostachys solani TaxID=160281 RepID=A0A9N9W136_9HYPO|nr:unnamed protein product [Clonostachys solani]
MWSFKKLMGLNTQKGISLPVEQTNQGSAAKQSHNSGDCIQGRSVITAAPCEDDDDSHYSVAQMFARRDGYSRIPLGDDDVENEDKNIKARDVPRDVTSAFNMLPFVGGNRNRMEGYAAVPQVYDDQAGDAVKARTADAPYGMVDEESDSDDDRSSQGDHTQDNREIGSIWGESTTYSYSR